MDSSQVFEEWTAYARKKTLLPREVDLESIAANAGFKIVSVTGVRRCGKSSVLMLLFQKLSAGGKKVGYVNLEDSRIKGNESTLDDVLKWFGDEGFLLLDEVTSAFGWEGWLARTHELSKGKLKLVVSSSRNSLVLPSKPLRGRILPHELYPLSFKEFLRFKGVEVEKTTAGRGRVEKAFAEYVKYGGFPEVALAKEEIDKVRILNSYFKDIIGDLVAGKIPLQKLVVTKTMTKMPGSYVGMQPHIELVKKMRVRSPDEAPGLGDRVPYVIVKGTELLSKRAEDPTYVLEKGLQIDSSYYIENQLLPPLERIFAALHISKSELLGNGRQMGIMESIRHHAAAQVVAAPEITAADLTGFTCEKCAGYFTSPPLLGACTCGGRLLFASRKGAAERMLLN